MTKPSCLIMLLSPLVFFSFIECAKIKNQSIKDDQFVEAMKIVKEILCVSCREQHETLIRICDKCNKKIIEKILCNRIQKLPVEELHFLLIKQNKKIADKNLSEKINMECIEEILIHIGMCETCKENLNQSFYSYLLNQPIAKVTATIFLFMILLIKVFPAK